MAETQVPWGLLHGVGVFTTFVWCPGQPIFLGEAHFNRLCHDAAALGLQVPWATPAQFFSAIQTESQRFEPGPQVIRVSLVQTASQSPHELAVYWSPRPLPQAKETCRLIWQTFDRPWPHIKHISRLPETIALQTVQAQGWDDFIRCNTRGQVTESAYANVFWLDAAGRLVTPDAAKVGCLPGLTAQAIMQAAADGGIPFEQDGNPVPETLLKAKAVFLTNCVRGFMPVSQLDNYTYQTDGLLPLLEALRQSPRLHGMP